MTAKGIAKDGGEEYNTHIYLLDMRKTIQLTMLGVALIFASCSGKKNAPAVVTTPTLTQTPSKAQTSKQTGSKSTPSKYSYSGPRVPGLKVSHVNVPGNYVALTFDDGPSPSLTPRVLDILKQNNAKATFFVVGRSVEKNKDILARAVAEGHEIGSHTWNHIKMTTSSTARVIDEMDRSCAAIKNATGIAPKVMRPPYGAVNASIVSLMKSRYGMPTIMWDVDTRDWQHPGVSVVINRAVGKARPGSIILLHDIHESTLQAVEGIVTGLQARGFRIVTVSQLLALNRYAVQQAATQTSSAVAPSETTTPAPPQAPAATPLPDSSPAPAPDVHAGAASISGATNN